MRTRYPSVATAASLFLLGTALIPSTIGAQSTQHYTVTPLTSNQASLAPVRDANLVNAWGLSRSSDGAWWVADNGTGLSTLYDGTGAVIPLVVPVPPSDPSSTGGSPTGTIFNGDPAAFPVTPGNPAFFLFATEDGTISGWNPAVSQSAVIVVNNKSKSVFKGLTAATAEVRGTTQTLLYAADFRQGRVAVFDSNFKPVTLRCSESRDGGDRDDGDRGGRDGEDHDNHGCGFTDERMPHGYAPFNVQNIGGNIYVTFAQQNDARHDEVDGAGKGYVDVFSPTGKLLLRLQHGDWLNAPWGLALGASDFGAYSHDILVGQFGSGNILAFDPVTGKYLGKLKDASNHPIAIDGLWGIAFGNGGLAGPANSLYFAAGPDHEQNGLLGTVTADENAQGNDQ